MINGNPVQGSVQVQSTEYPRLLNVFQKDVTVQNAYHLLDKTIFERKLLVTPVDHPNPLQKPPDHTLKYLYNKYVVPFLRSALRSFLTFGYVTYTIVSKIIPEIGNMEFTYPLFVSPLNLSITRITNPNWEITWQIKKASQIYISHDMNKEADTPPPVPYYIAFYEGYEPDEYGAHQSPVKTILSASAFAKQYQKAHVFATVQRSRPSLIITHTAEKAKHMDTIKAYETTHPEMFHQTEATKRAKTNAASSGNKRDVAAYVGKPLLTNEEGDVWTYRPTVIDERMELRPGLEVSHTQAVLPEAQPDLLEHVADYREMVALAMGIPYNLLSSKNRRGEASKMSAEDLEIYQNNLGYTKRQLCDLLEQIHVMLNPSLGGVSDLHFDLMTTPSNLLLG